MENAMVRTRSTRRPVQNRRRRRAPGTGIGLGPLIARQLAISLLLLIIVCIVKNINFSAAKTITDNVKYVISYNVELKSVFEYVGKLASEIRDSISPSPAGKPGVTEPQISETARNSGATQTSSGALTSGSPQTSGANLSSSMPQTSNTAPASNTETASNTSQSSPAALVSNTATLSSSESVQDNVEKTDQNDKTMVASSAIDNEVGQDETASAGAGTMPESSVLAASSGTDLNNPSGMLIPLEGNVISQFGEKSADAAGNGKIHKGIDIAATRNSSIRAVLDGKVTDTGSSPSYGNYIRILHADGLQTIYANCLKLDVKKGDIVKKGDTIAEIGGTGASVGIHLHFEIWKDGTAVDPLEYISLRIS